LPRQAKVRTHIDVEMLRWRCGFSKQAHPLDFVQDQHSLVFANGSKLNIADKGVFTSVGTSPRGSTWARLPIPATGLGPRCECDMDTHYKAGDFACGCKPCEVMGGNCSSNRVSPCEACPETAGSDCSRCDNPPKDGSSFPPPCDSHCMAEKPAVYDQVKVPAGLKPGMYVVGFRYDW
jgi:hypothetical protein